MHIHLLSSRKNNSCQTFRPTSRQTADNIIGHEYAKLGDRR